MYLPNLQVIEGTQPKYSKIPERITKATTPADVTFNNIDTINLVDKLLNEITNETQLLEELQFSFILYLCGLSVDSLAHWRQIVSLLCNSDSAIEKYRNFYIKFVNVIKFQLPEIPIEFVEQSPSNSIYHDIKNLLKNLHLSSLTDVSKILQEHLRETINWTFDDLLDEDPDDLPTIVET
jgi:A1 cistron-splicing factor AAR2